MNLLDFLMLGIGGTSAVRSARKANRRARKDRLDALSVLAEARRQKDAAARAKLLKEARKLLGTSRKNSRSVRKILKTECMPEELQAI